MYLTWPGMLLRKSGASFLCRWAPVPLRAGATGLWHVRRRALRRLHRKISDRGRPATVRCDNHSGGDVVAKHNDRRMLRRNNSW
jgi:hypothetical protein